MPSLGLSLRIFKISWKCDEQLAETSSGNWPRKKFRNLQAWLGMTWLFCNLHSKPLTKYFHPWRPRQRPTSLKRSNLACGGCDSSRLEGGLWGGEAPPGKKFKLVLGCLNLGELWQSRLACLTLEHDCVDQACSLALIVWDLVARGYFIPGRTRQRGGGRAPAFRVAPCQTPPGVQDLMGWVGPVRLILSDVRVSICSFNGVR